MTKVRKEETRRGHDKRGSQTYKRKRMEKRRTKRKGIRHAKGDGEVT